MSSISLTGIQDDIRDDVRAASHGQPMELPPGSERDAIDAVRFLAADAVEAAGSGHPGTAMALAPLAYQLFTRELRHDPADPDWPDRDRFILSIGHASMLQYAALHLSGYDLRIEDLARFRQTGSRTPGHPERGHTAGIEVSTGPLGQGISMAVGEALAERMLADTFNRPGHAIVDHRTWVVAGDGDMMEGVTSEATSLAGTLGLDRLTVFYDDNHISIEGSTDLAFCEDVARRFDAHGWHIVRVDDVNDLVAVEGAITAARQETERPTLIVVRSHIGYGSPKQGDAAAHGAPLGPQALAETRRSLGWTHGPFEVPEQVRKRWRAGVTERATARDRWQEAFVHYQREHPVLAKEFERRMAGDLPQGWTVDGLVEAVDGDDPEATRKSMGAALNAAAAGMPELVGGSADLAPSTVTTLEGEGDVGRRAFSGRNLHFGVREHAMGAVLNGIAAHGGLRAFGATFFVFSDYLKPAIRLAALMGLPVTYVFTHDSIGVGEDGPTHQPIEHLAALRSIPGLTVLRPADATETALAVEAAVTSDGPTALILSRQAVPRLDPAGLRLGGSVIADGADATILATGSEVGLGLAARDLLTQAGIQARVVSLPSWELFRARPVDERERLIPPGVPTIAVEAASSQGWHEFADEVIAIDRFGVSAPAADAFAEVGLTAERITEHVRRLVTARSNGSGVPRRDVGSTR